MPPHQHLVLSVSRHSSKCVAVSRDDFNLFFFGGGLVPNDVEHLVMCNFVSEIACPWVIWVFLLVCFRSFVHSLYILDTSSL